MKIAGTHYTRGDSAPVRTFGGVSIRAIGPTRGGHYEDADGNRVSPGLFVDGKFAGWDKSAILVSTCTTHGLSRREHARFIARDVFVKACNKASSQAIWAIARHI